MSDLIVLRQYLCRVENDIADTKQRIAGYHKDAMRARFTNRDAGPAQQLLDSWKGILVSMQQHRDNLLAEIEAKEAAPDQATLAVETWRK